MEIENSIRYPCGLMVERRLKYGGFWELNVSVEADPLDPGLCPIHGKNCPPHAVKHPYAQV